MHEEGVWGSQCGAGVPRPEATSVVGCRVRGILNFECVNFELLPCPPCPPSPLIPTPFGRGKSEFPLVLLPAPDSRLPVFQKN
ncbi:MAG: hypothetical protein CLLPBCKN_001382 [Chroococcidiopsis cubana SAG 39.79]|uniref:hypothetical protein n=1 Tax=Chroococcidiopsis cubana TaxID=171392 RepID=UPI002AC688BD|nr:hypothetical protein [Chroococcidiopsis cubana]MDZ4871994.1 hypothetical protein [Chroococcidiopsis cubana SAG 39.79]